MVYGAWLLSVQATRSSGPQTEGNHTGEVTAPKERPGTPGSQYDLRRLNENDYHNGVHLHLPAPTGRTGSS